MNIKLKEMLYKEKKLMLMLGMSLATTATLTSCGDSKKNDVAVAEKSIQDDVNLSSGVSSLFEYYLENDCYGVSAGVTRSLNNIRRETYLEYEENVTIEVESDNELEGSSFVSEEKTYYDFPCSPGLQDYIISIADSYEIPYEIMFTIIHRESGGDWNSNGYISSTNDYGLCQINKCNFADIYDELGFTEDDILNDPYKNIEASAYLIKRIFNVYGYTKDNFEYENVFGCYNGWTNWKKKKMATSYVSGCMKILEEKFGDLEEDTKRGI
jgi:hypothetical protein